MWVTTQRKTMTFFFRRCLGLEGQTVHIWTGITRRLRDARITRFRYAGARVGQRRTCPLEVSDPLRRSVGSGSWQVITRYFSPTQWIRNYHKGVLPYRVVVKLAQGSAAYPWRCRPSIDVLGSPSYLAYTSGFCKCINHAIENTCHLPT